MNRMALVISFLSFALGIFVAGCGRTEARVPDREDDQELAAPADPCARNTLQVCWTDQDGEYVCHGGGK